LKWVFAVIAAVVVLTAAAVVAIPRLVDLPRIQTLVANNASHALGRPVRFASLSLSIFPLPGVTLHKLEVGEDPRFGATPFLTLDSGRLRVRLRPLFTGRIEFAELVLAKPVIRVIRDTQGRLNVASLGAAPEPRPAPRGPSRPTAGTSAAAATALPTAVTISDGVVVYVAQGAAPARYRLERVDVTLKAAAPQVAFKGSARLNPGDVALKIADGVLTVPASHVFADAPVRATVTIEGDDLTPLVAAVAAPATTVAGTVKGMLAIGGTVGAPTASGDVNLGKVVVARTSPHCPEPKRRTLTIPAVTLNAAWRQRRLTAQPLQAELPKGTVTARLTADVQRGVHVRLDDLAVRGVPVESVLVDFLCQGYAVSGPLDLTGSLSFAAARPLETLSGPGSVKIGAGKIVGKEALNLIGGVVRVGGAVSSLLNADLPPSAFASPVEFDSITGTYRIADGVATTRDLVYTSRAMKVSVAGDYVLVSGAMNLDMLVNHGRGEVRAKVTGTSASPSIRVLPSSVLRGLEADTVESGLRDLLKQFR
jgi:uncharacterized protein involved in outer membrane biogenesis